MLLGLYQSQAGQVPGLEQKDVLSAFKRVRIQV
jgi:hypothetical protein